MLEILEEIKKEYPDGTTWGPEGTPNSNYYAGGGFAAMVSDRIFGRTNAPAREVTDRSKVRAGDICTTFSGVRRLVHAGIVSCDAYEVHDTYAFHVADGNSGAQAKWFTNNSYLRDGVRVFTRYPV